MDEQENRNEGRLPIGTQFKVVIDWPCQYFLSGCQKFLFVHDRALGGIAPELRGPEGLLMQD